MTLPEVTDDVFRVNGAEKSFGAVRALDGVSLGLAPGECLGLVGHNGAGKSTLVTTINGVLRPDAGQIFLNGREVTHTYSIAEARASGIRCVFQELSLCPNLSVVENTRITHPTLTGFGWRQRAHNLIISKLDEIFPGHTVRGDQHIADLTIAERQMVEIAMAFSESDQAVRLVILDEPTSSLDGSLASQLLAHVRRFVRSGGSVVFISHILGEILSTCDRIVVMKDGRIVAERPASEFSTETLVGAMGSVVRARAERRLTSQANASAALIRRAARDGEATEFVAFPGEIIGLAGLGGHGQTEMLVNLFMDEGGAWRTPTNARMAFVAGDRHVDGNMPLWSLLKNMTITLLPDLSRFGLVNRSREDEIAQSWSDRIAVRAPNLSAPILSLSGGNQQKVLFARALASRSPIVLMDDPMRGVDIGTKQEVYSILRSEAENGRTFIWYSTEMDEICQCDRVYVFREGRIVAELIGDSINEESVLASSFAEEAA